MKRAVKKGSAQAQSYAKRQQEEKQRWTMRVIAYEEQYMLDAVALCLNECFGMGEERLKRFHDAFEKKYQEIRELEQTEDNDYAKAKVEEALKRVWGKYYEPREVRYTVRIITPDGTTIEL